MEELNQVRAENNNREIGCTRTKDDEGGGVEESVFFEDRGRSDNYAIRKKSSAERKHVSSKWRGKISRDSYLIPFTGLTSNQWRKLKNLWFPGRTPFRPSCFGTGKKKRFFAQLAHSASPTCILYLAKEASDRLEFLPSWDSMDQDLLLLNGQHRSTLVHHMDVEKASDFFFPSDFDELETSLFHFYLPSSYLSFVCSGEGVDLFNLGIPPK
ncbi:hypothetical protein Peur_029515 [Populus x canadensis]